MIAQNAPTGAGMHAQHLTLAEQGCRRGCLCDVLRWPPNDRWRRKVLL